MDYYGPSAAALAISDTFRGDIGRAGLARDCCSLPDRFSGFEQNWGDLHGRHGRLYLTDYSKVIPVVNLAKPYQVLLPKTDSDGNDVSGVRVPDVAVPVATYSGWNLRKAGFAEGEPCGSTGSTIPFALTAAARIASGDPRPSLAERYSSGQDYVSKVRAAAEALVKQRLLLAEDVDVYVKAAQKYADQKTAAWQRSSVASR